MRSKAGSDPAGSSSAEASAKDGIAAPEARMSVKLRKWFSE